MDLEQFADGLLKIFPCAVVTMGVSCCRYHGEIFLDLSRDVLMSEDWLKKCQEVQTLAEKSDDEIFSTIESFSDFFDQGVRLKFRMERRE